MARRSRKARRAAARKSTAAVRKAAPAKVVPTTRPRNIAGPRATTERDKDFTKDYYYVYNDLRMLLVVALIIVVIMFGLSYLL